jgi:hypothetical protein
MSKNVEFMLSLKPRYPLTVLSYSVFSADMTTIPEKNKKKSVPSTFNFFSQKIVSSRHLEW